MTDYEKGLEKLGLPTHDAWLDGTGRALMDLRKDPAFAWRVLEAYCASDKHWTIGRWPLWKREHDTAAVALYAAVEEIGKH